MNSGKYLSTAEGCSSSESGWTMYIASPMQEDGDYDADYSDQNPTVNDGNAANEDSDDSMASDASSGPQHQHQHENHYESTHKMIGSKNSKQGKFKNHSPVIIDNKKEKKNGQSISKDRRFAAFKKHSK